MHNQPQHDDSTLRDRRPLRLVGCVRYALLKQPLIRIFFIIV